MSYGGISAWFPPIDSTNRFVLALGLELRVGNVIDDVIDMDISFAMTGDQKNSNPKPSCLLQRRYTAT